MEREVKEYLHAIKKRLWLVLIIAELVAFLGYFYSLHSYTPLYQASTRVLIDTNSEMPTLLVMIKDPSVMREVLAEMDLNWSSSSLASRISVTNINSSKVVNISVVDANPQRAADLANTTARVYKSQIANVMNFHNVYILTNAKPNNFPINKNPLVRDTMVAMVIGLIAGLGLAILFDVMDRTVRSVRDVEEMLDAPLLGVVSKMSQKNIKKKNLKVGVELRGETVGIK